MTIRLKLKGRSSTVQVKSKNCADLQYLTYSIKDKISLASICLVIKIILLLGS